MGGGIHVHTCPLPEGTVTRPSEGISGLSPLAGPTPVETLWGTGEGAEKERVKITS